MKNKWTKKEALDLIKKGELTFGMEENVRMFDTNFIFIARLKGESICLTNDLYRQAKRIFENDSKIKNISIDRFESKIQKINDKLVINQSRSGRSIYIINQENSNQIRISDHEESFGDVDLNGFEKPQNYTMINLNLNEYSNKKDYLKVSKEKELIEFIKEELLN